MGVFEFAASITHHPDWQAEPPEIGFLCDKCRILAQHRQSPQLRIFREIFGPEGNYEPF